jgi:hypothetical protein
VRRCEVVIAAIHHLHRPHRIELSAAHGEGELGEFLSDEDFDVTAAAEPGGLSKDGFTSVYWAPCMRIGALTNELNTRPGVRADIDRIRAGLSDLLDLADQAHLSTDDLRAAGHLCLCEAAVAEDGAWLRRVLVEDAAPDQLDDRHRQLTAGLLLEALHDEPSARPTDAFRNRWAFGVPEGDPEGDERAKVAALWRAAALRNFSVGAWRALWRWLAAQLNAEPMTAQDLGDRLGRSDARRPPAANRWKFVASRRGGARRA